jgi:hypothetical protein
MSELSTKEDGTQKIQKGRADHSLSQTCLRDHQLPAQGGRSRTHLTESPAPPTEALTVSAYTLAHFVSTDMVGVSNPLSVPRWVSTLARPGFRLLPRPLRGGSDPDS